MAHFFLKKRLIQTNFGSITDISDNIRWDEGDGRRLLPLGRDQNDVETRQKSQNRKSHFAVCWKWQLSKQISNASSIWRRRRLTLALRCYDDDDDDYDAGSCCSKILSPTFLALANTLLHQNSFECVCESVCVRERERERERAIMLFLSHSISLFLTKTCVVFLSRPF